MAQFVEVKTVELTGQALDWAVSRVEGVEYIKDYIVTTERNIIGEILSSSSTSNYRPSTDWAQGGLLLDKHKPWVSPPVEDPDPCQPFGWDAEIYDEDGREVIGHAIGGKTALIAICRAIVLSKLGDLVQVPAELVGASK